jgi:hypothetical protein
MDVTGDEAAEWQIAAAPSTPHAVPAQSGRIWGRRPNDICPKFDNVLIVEAEKDALCHGSSLSSRKHQA